MGLINYKNKVCVVTGAASGIGLATVKLLLEEGAIVYALDLNEISINNIMTLKCDLTSKDSIDTCFETIPDHIDCFFGVAGLSGAITNYYKTFTVNYIANKYITETYLKTRMNEGGAICYVTSVAGNHWDKYSKEFQLFTKAKTWEEMINVLEYQAREDTVGMMAYPFSKRAMNHYMAEAAVEFGKKHVRVNALLPGSTDTGMKKEFEVEAGGEANLISQTGLAGRLATPEEMAKPLLFLNSDMASFISGICLTVDYCNDALVKLGLKKDLLNVKVGSKLYNLGFMQKMFKKQLAPLHEEEKKEETVHFEAKTNNEQLSDKDFREKVEQFNNEVNDNLDATKIGLEIPNSDELKQIEEVDSTPKIVNDVDNLEELRNQVNDFNKEANNVEEVLEVGVSTPDIEELDKVKDFEIKTPNIDEELIDYENKEEILDAVNKEFDEETI